MSVFRKPRASLGADEARRLALAAQGFAEPRPGSGADRRAVVRTVRRLGLVQMDSVNVLVRSHYLPLYSRLGAYPTDWLDAAAYAGRRRKLFEYWGHEASLLPVERQPLLRWRMQRAKNGDGLWGGVARFGREHARFCNEVLAEIRDRGPLGVSELAAGGRRKGGWWGWSEGKVALEWLFWTGQVTTHSRRSFERIYDLTERALPAEVVRAPTPDLDAAQRELLRISLRALGVATERDLRDYFRLTVADARDRIAELVESGEFLPVQVDGWRVPAYVPHAVRIPRRIEACALLSPFDSLVWFRDRMQRLFDFHYRIEIYTPAHKRRHGYYVLPFLLGDRLVARVDLKSDRTAGRLRVLSTHYEPWVDRAGVKAALDEELGRLARWLALR
ncbi:MAG TPA: crosslink repair DNA glycosylase YcaQ family protein [Steroidobacteraceae bacterium]|nr:crosslink repair DNA glycosylase YcaQ family protein [Steroidobacteraceae bacterium]